jgi:carboxylesterase type B
VNIFGFPGGPGTDTNLGLKDQRLAVEWVERNIAAFGGSSKKIVIAGQSSGGVAVDWYSYAYKQNPIVSGLISTSGNAFSFPMNSPERQRNNWYNVSAALGCGSTGNTVECMRKKPWQEIQAAVAKVPASTGGSPVRSTPPFFPMIDNKVIFDPRDYLSRSKRGDFAKVPYFLGHNNNEQGYYVIPAFAQGRNVTEEQAATFLLQSFVCPVSHEARSRVDARVPTWVYRYHGDWFNTRLYPTSGAYHGVDLHMIMGGSVDATGLPTSRAQRETTELIQGAIFAFVNDPKNGLNRYGWPQFNPRTKSWIDIAKDNKPKATFVEPKKYDSPCSDITMAAMEPVP